MTTVVNTRDVSLVRTIVRVVATDADDYYPTAVNCIIGIDGKCILIFCYDVSKIGKFRCYDHGFVGVRRNAEECVDVFWVDSNISPSIMSIFLSLSCEYYILKETKS